MLVEGVGDLPPTNEYYSSHVIIVVIYQGHMALEITDIVLEALSRLHEEVIVALQFSSGSILVVEGLLHIFKALE